MKKLASLEMTLICLGGLVVWLALGAWMAVAPSFKTAFMHINHNLVFQWLAGPAQESPLLMVWFLVLCVWAAFLFLNLVLCLCMRLWQQATRSGKSRWWLLFIAHIMFGVVMLTHAAGLTLGYKKDGLILKPGQTVEWGQSWQMTLQSMHYKSDPAYLKLSYMQARQQLTRKRFPLGINYAMVELKRDGQTVAQGRVGMLEPLVQDGLRVTLTKFMPPADPSEKPGARLVVSSSPLTGLFFGGYAALIIGLLVLAFTTWRRRPNGAQ
jgi:hypothetical protein